jgi:hypothetical protein
MLRSLGALALETRRWSMDGHLVQVAATAVLFVAAVGVVWYFGPRRFGR